MKNREIFSIVNNKLIAKDVFELIIEGDTSCICAAGQFVHILIERFYLRRPISICDYDKNTITLIYKTVGKGTKALSEMCKGQSLDIISGLGNGFTVMEHKTPLLIGGGVGVPPLYGLARKLIEMGAKPIVVMGFANKNDVFYEKEFKKLGCTVYITTNDGTYGQKGFVTDILKGIEYDYFYTCGPEAMLKAVYQATSTDGQFSFEERMACGIGACMGCTCKTKYGNKRICKEGPVLNKGEIIW